MSTTLFTGVPGSGKTYKMMCEVWRNKDKYFILHNIIGFDTDLLKGFGLNWQNYIIENNLEPDVFFSKEYQSELAKRIEEKYKRPMLIIIDEAHEWFDVHKKSIKMWLSYHRHLNQQIYLVAHASENIPRVYRSFIELEYRAKSSSIIFLPYWFMYNRIVGYGQKEGAGYVFERKRKEIFDLYKSADIKEGKVNKSLLVPIMLLFMVGCLVYFIKAPDLIYGKEKKESIVEIEKTEQIKKDDISKTKKEEEKNTIKNQYAYIGNFNGEGVVENIETGRQSRLSDIGGRMIVNRGADYAAVELNGKLYELNSSRRYTEQKRNSDFNISSEANERPPVSE